MSGVWKRFLKVLSIAGAADLGVAPRCAADRQRGLQVPPRGGDAPDVALLPAQAPELGDLGVRDELRRRGHCTEWASSAMLSYPMNSSFN